MQQALKSGPVTQEGTATVDGTQAIARSVTLRSVPTQTTTLFVDAQIYRRT